MTTPIPLDTRLRRLRLGYMAGAVEAQNAESLTQKHSYLEFLEALVDGELGTRENKSLMKRIKAARFPVLKALAEFDFDFQPKLDVKLIKTLATCDFIEQYMVRTKYGMPEMSCVYPVYGRKNTWRISNAD